MLITEDLFLGIAPRTTERTARMGAPSGARAVDRQTDPVAIFEGLVALGTAHHREQGLASRAGIQALGEIAQGIIRERSGQGEISSCRRVHQCFDSMKAVLTEDLTDQQSPQQSLRGNLRLPPTVSRIPKIFLESKTPRHKVQQATWRGAAHLFFFFGLFSCWRASTNSWALAANTSRTASWNSRPAATRRRTSSIQCLGMCWTRFFP